MANEIMKLVTQISCNSVTKKQNETLSVRVNYTYQGPAKTARLGAVVTQQLGVLEFDEIGSTRKEVYVNLAESQTPSTLYSNITGLPLSGCSPQSGYGVKVYALDLDGKPEWGCKNVLTVQSVVTTPTLNVTSLSLS
jgi:hypothetical protein